MEVVVQGEVQGRREEAEAAQCGWRVISVFFSRQSCLL
jgi:hypothetical protein